MPTPRSGETEYLQQSDDSFLGLFVCGDPEHPKAIAIYNSVVHFSVGTHICVQGLYLGHH